VGIRGVEEGRANRDYLQTQFELLKSRDLAEEVVRRLDLVNHAEFDPAQQPEPLISIGSLLDWRRWVYRLGLGGVIPTTSPEALAAPDPVARDRFAGVVGAFRGRLSVAPRNGTQMVDLRVQMADPALAAAAANAVAQVYIDQQLAARVAMTEQATGWMSRQLSELKAQLDDSERRLQAYVQREDLVNMDGVTTVEASELSQLNTRLVEARQSFARAENQYNRMVEVAGGGWREHLTVPAVRSNALVAQYLTAEADARSRVDALAQRYGPRHPTMIEAKDELTVATEALRSQVQARVASIEQEYSMAQTNLRSLESAFDANREAMREVQQKEFQFREIKREVELNRTLYDTFLNRLKETSATADLDDPNARIVDSAPVPKSPIKPKKTQMTLIASVLALMVTGGLAVLRELMDNRVRSGAEVEEKLRMPLLGLLPLEREGTERRDMARLYQADRDPHFSEAVRTLRTGVVLSSLDAPRTALMVTSSISGEGKTTLAVNLATALGQMERVLLLEGDLRKPAFREVFALSSEAPGFADVMAGEADLEDAIHHVDGIDVLACGATPPNPLELVSSHPFVELLEQLSSEYDRILIDAPPVEAVSDPLVLATCASSVLFVVQSDATPVPLVRKSLERLREINAPIAGVVLDQVDLEKSRQYDYLYGYRYAEAGYYGPYGHPPAGTPSA
jgi:capsular exopolysaccharide synthesis family protein